MKTSLFFSKNKKLDESNIVRLDILAGSTFDSVARDAVNTVKGTHYCVSFVFNGKKFLVNDKTKESELRSQYEEKCMSLPGITNEK
jgi:hypothetical protein